MFWGALKGTEKYPVMHVAPWHLHVITSQQVTRKAYFTFIKSTWVWHPAAFGLSAPPCAHIAFHGELSLCHGNWRDSAAEFGVVVHGEEKHRPHALGLVFMGRDNDHGRKKSCHDLFRA
jgi:hypothetical protein